ncbi:MAG: ABC transporter ATP-binding protein [Phycisphaerae bacterium]|nr:ABC transporter ATP-binding protein [Phycisphaerae bacterium]
MISLRQVKKRFGRIDAVRGVSVDIPRGQVVGILGPNGAGKSTTVRMIAAAIPPTSGSVHVAGLDAVGRSLEVRRKMGYMPESAPLYREMRVRDLLRYRAGLYGLTGRERAEAVRRAAGQCQLEAVMHRRCGELSKGYRQRTGLASVLLHNPEVLILDEPTSGLDPAQIAETRSLIKELAGRRTMLIVSHILPEVQKSCDRIVLFAGGRVRADGSPDELIRQLSGTEQYAVEAKGPRRAEEVLGALAGVRACESTALADGWQRCVITFAQGMPDQREMIARAAGGAGLLVRELAARTTTLEEVYLRLLAGDAAPEAEPEGASP